MDLGPRTQFVTKSGDIGELAAAVREFLQLREPER
jgi:hypothetical protein